VQDALARDFSQNQTSPIFLAVGTAGAGAAEVDGLAGGLRELSDVLAVTPPRPLGPGTARIDVYSKQRALDDATQRLVSDVRGWPTRLNVLAGGEAAEFKDQQASFRSRLPLALLIVCLTTGFLLFLMTGSVVLPVKTLLLNVVSLSATLGFLVLVFEDGRLEGLFDYTSQGALNASQPILVGAVAFALSTDYAVFVLARIKEARDRGADDTEAVAIGIERTGRIVTAAALMLAVAIGAFVTSEIVLIKQLGLGIAFAVLLDATIVRALLVPSLMKLLGPLNWWAPAPLRRLHARIGVVE
jgi:RND superfamily putative drug exporter